MKVMTAIALINAVAHLNVTNTAMLSGRACLCICTVHAYCMHTHKRPMFVCVPGQE